jgi:hypothetical protein
MDHLEPKAVPFSGKVAAQTAGGGTDQGELVLGTGHRDVELAEIAELLLRIVAVQRPIKVLQPQEVDALELKAEGRLGCD